MAILLLTSCVLYDRAYYERALLRFSDDDGDKWSEAQGDCDDTNADISPWADEYCNGLDDDCNTLVDDFPLDVRVWYADSDHDGFGKEGTTPILQCETIADYVSNDNDCDDADADVYFGAEQVCGDPRDTDCDGNPGDFDEDLDGSPNCLDCQDEDPAGYPGAPERCNFLDDDCDGAVDEEDAIDPIVWYADNDGDDYGTGDPVVSCSQPDSNYIDVGGDCDDADLTIHPNADEVCDDGIDDNCNGMLHECRATGALPVAGFAYADSAAGGVSVLSAVGDLDEDGLAEYVLGVAGEPGETAMLIGSGPVYGGVAQSEMEFKEIVAPPDAYYVGAWVEVVGDTDRDEIDEWAVGSELGPPDYLGEVYVFRGRFDDIDLAESSYAVITGTGASGGLGYSATTPGDIGGDVGSDLVLGQPLSAALTNAGGAAHIYFEPFGTYTDQDADLSLYGSEENLNFGIALESGDFDGDGVTDLVVGAQGTVDGVEDAGATFLFYGALQELNSDDADARFVGESDSEAGKRLQVPGDTNGDGEDDLWIGAPSSGLVHLLGGEWFLVTDFSGSSALRASASAIIVGEAVADELGYNSSVATDFDQDGMPDLILQGRSDEGGSSAGKIFLFYGPFAGEKSAADADAWYVGSDTYADAGSTLSVPGDLNGDGELDLIWGESGTSTSTSRQISFFYGPTY